MQLGLHNPVIISLKTWYLFRPPPPNDLSVTENSVIEGWASFLPDEWDNTEEPMPASILGSQSVDPILLQFEEYCNEADQPVEPTISVKHLKERGNQLHQYWKSKKQQWPELSTFALGHLAFSGAGVGVERLFSGAAVQVEGRMRSLSNAALKERSP